MLFMTKLTLKKPNLNYVVPLGLLAVGIPCLVVGSIQAFAIIGS